MSTTGRVLFVAEIAICFGPVFALLLVGAAIAPFQLVVLIGMPNIDSLLFIAWVICGALGTVALQDISRGILDRSSFAANPKVTLIFAVMGIGALMAFFVFFSGTSGFIWIVLLPLVAALHMLYLGRDFLFGW